MGGPISLFMYSGKEADNSAGIYSIYLYCNDR